MRITLDTNQLVRALMRPPELATFIMAWQAKRFTVVCSSALLDEYQRVLHYPDVAELIYGELRRIFFTQLIEDMEMIQLDEIPPICSDPEDDKVIATAILGSVDYLATDDDHIRTRTITSLLHAEGILLTTIDDLLILLG
ncbi:MAG: putative toxin-antitoxin system toxin component, PIN family [Caldilineaceae bacterium]|jgi:putative PIN family toxin of toxin-antitoxin system